MVGGQGGQLPENIAGLFRICCASPSKLQVRICRNETQFLLDQIPDILYQWAESLRTIFLQALALADKKNGQHVDPCTGLTGLGITKLIT